MTDTDTLTDPNPLGDEWAVVDAAGKHGHTFEMTVAFTLPAVNGAHDRVAQAIVADVETACVRAGARTVAGDVRSLTGMGAG